MNCYKKTVLVLFTSLTVIVSSNGIDEISAPSLGQEMDHSTLLLLRHTRNAEYGPCCGSFNETYSAAEDQYVQKCGHILKGFKEENNYSIEETDHLINVDEEGYVIREKYMDHCVNLYPEPEIKEIFKHYAPSCIMECEIEAIREKDIAKRTGREFVNPMASKVIVCITTTIGKVCPKQYYSK
ncbi:hypothetical protein L9F63_022435, partial [Diploptera punctata]